MALIVFLRGVNVGGHKAFKPSVLAKDLAALDVVSVGAAGTFVIRKRVGQAALRAEFLKRLSFVPELMVCQAREVLELAASEPFEVESVGDDVVRYVSVLAKRLRTSVRLPICRPAGDEWQVKAIAIRGRFALSLHRRLGRTLVYPNEVVEKCLGVPATTRKWNTIAAVCEILKRA
ncbi:MAG TPA: DUF1697 domain-containing protein [Pirellulales bacterium]|jgi:uncharacterized protein (DUF1697 family)|nr:DUF1697 domain-containing protein [Pirellulales bacterium]